MIKVFKTIYNKDDEKKLFAQGEDDLNLIALIDKDRVKLKKDDKAKYEFYNEGVFEGKLFVEKNDFVPEMYLRSNIGKILKEKGINKSEFARKIGLGYSNAYDLSVREYLDNSYFLTIAKTARALEVNIEDLFEYEEEVEAKLLTKQDVEKFKKIIEDYNESLKGDVE